ncbi:hypothetical protein FL859_07400 [Listeria monocytogenes]|nr:hypothetical protein [Listeria monocytogenes]
MNSLEPRNEVESIIIEHNIDRKTFFEVDKISYKKIENKIISKFINQEDGFDFNLHRGYLRYNHKLRCIGISYQKNDWWEWFKLVPSIVGQTAPVYVVFTGDNYTWIYTGYLEALMKILYYGSPIGEGDCYIVSPKFDWLIGYSDDGDYVTCVDNGLFFSIDKMVLLDNDINVHLLPVQAH